MYALLPKGVTLQTVEDIKCLCDNIAHDYSKTAPERATQWYHHHSQHPGHTHLEETTNAMMYWKVMRTTIRTLIHNCKGCQVNKRRKRWKYENLPLKNVITNPLGNVMCGNDGSIVEFKGLTMINPARSWFENVELLLRTVA